MTTQKSTLRYSAEMGLILAVFSILVEVVARSLGYEPYELQQSSAKWVLPIIPIAFGLWASVNYKNKFGGGYIAYGKVVLICVSVFAFSGLFKGVVDALYYQFFDPGYADRMVEFQMEKMLEDNPEIPEQGLETAESWMRNMSKPALSIPVGIIFSALFGLVVGLIGGLFIRKEMPGEE